MAAEDYFDPYETAVDACCDGLNGNFDDFPQSKYPADFPCRKCHFLKNFKCTRIKGVQKCPYADWFAEHNGKG